MHIRQVVYEGAFDSPKTAAGLPCLPLSAAAMELLATWRRQATRTGPDDLVFRTRTGKPISPNNILRRWVFPACEAQGIPRATWLTFRRTYSSWSHDKGVPAKVTAELMGHAKVDVTLNTYTQVLPDALRAAANTVGSELIRMYKVSGRGSG